VYVQCTYVFLAGKSPNIRSYTLYRHGSGQPCVSAYVCVCSRAGWSQETDKRHTPFSSKCDHIIATSLYPVWPLPFLLQLGMSGTEHSQQEKKQGEKHQEKGLREKGLREAAGSHTRSLSANKN